MFFLSFPGYKLIYFESRKYHLFIKMIIQWMVHLSQIYNIFCWNEQKNKAFFQTILNTKSDNFSCNFKFWSDEVRYFVIFSFRIILWLHARLEESFAFGWLFWRQGYGAVHLRHEPLQQRVDRRKRNVLNFGGIFVHQVFLNYL